MTVKYTEEYFQGGLVGYLVSDGLLVQAACNRAGLIIDFGLGG